MEKLREQFEIETGQGKYSTEGKEPLENNGSFNDAYVIWLEERLVKNIKHDALLVDEAKRSEQFSLKQLWIMAQKYNSCDFIKMVEEIERLNCH